MIHTVRYFDIHSSNLQYNYFCALMIDKVQYPYYSAFELAIRFWSRLERQSSSLKVVILYCLWNIVRTSNWNSQDIIPTSFCNTFVKSSDISSQRTRNGILVITTLSTKPPAADVAKKFTSDPKGALNKGEEDSINAIVVSIRYIKDDTYMVVHSL